LWISIDNQPRSSRPTARVRWTSTGKVNHENTI
jgi:hypothetical protein